MALSPIEQRVKFIFEEKGLQPLSDKVQKVNEILSKHSAVIKEVMKSDGKLRNSQKKTNETIKTYKKNQELAIDEL